jgi:hypothetical protein
MMAKTLRDEFAMAAMAGMHAADTDISKRECATAAYQMADAMMEERQKHLSAERTYDD